jgi:hypothetical protein
MRDALITLAGASLSLFLLVSVMSPGTEQQSVSRPTTEDTGRHGLKAVHSWLQESGVNSHSLRKPFARIDQEPIPATGNMMIISLPLSREALDSEWQALHQWVSDGNSVMLLASLYHVPQWSDRLGWIREDQVVEAVGRLSAEEFVLRREDIEAQESEFSLGAMQDSIRAFKPAPYRLYPALKHSLFEQVYELESVHTPGAYRYRDENGGEQHAFWSIDSDAARLALRVMYGESRDMTAMWLLPVGEGWIYLSAFPGLFSNSLLKQQDNARWFDNLLSHAVADGAFVVFDDYHFGLSDLYDPEAFFADRRLHNSLLFIGVFWLVYALGRSPRLAPVRNPAARPASTDFIEAMAGFFTRRIRSRTIARELATRLLEDAGDRTQLDGDALWNWLRDHPQVSEHDIRRLQRASGHAQGKTKLIPLTRSIHRIQKVLS